MAPTPNKIEKYHHSALGRSRVSLAGRFHVACICFLARFANACEDSFSLQAGLKSREELKTELEDRERTTKEGKKDSAASTSTPLALGGGGATLQLGSGEAEKDADDIDAANVAVSRVRRKASTLTYKTCEYFACVRVCAIYCTKISPHMHTAAHKNTETHTFSYTPTHANSFTKRIATVG